MQKHKSNDNPWRAAGLVSAIMVDLIVCIILGYLVGSWLSDRMGEPKFLLIGTLGGLFVAFVTIVMLIRFYVKDTK